LPSNTPTVQCWSSRPGRTTAWGSGSVWPISGRAFLIPKPAKYPLSTVSGFAVAPLESWIAPADSSKSTRRIGRSYFPQPRLNEAARAADASRAWKWRW